MEARRVICLVVLLVLLPRSAEAQEHVEQAREAFQRGAELAESGRCPEAIEQFWISYRLVPSQPSPIYAIGVCQMQLGGAENDRGALESFDQYLDQGTNEERIQEVQAHLATLLGRLAMGTARIEVTPQDATVRVNDQEVPAGRLERVRLPTGAHSLHVSAEGYEDTEHEVNVVAGQVTDVSVELLAAAPAAPPPVADPPPEIEPEEPETSDTSSERRGIHQRWWFWTIIGAVVIGGAATGLALGLQSGDEVPSGGWNVELP